MAALFVLLLYINGSVREHMGYWEDPNTGSWTELGISGCLAMKRTLKRQGWKDLPSGQTRFSCEKRTVELKTDSDGNIVIAKVL